MRLLFDLGHPAHVHLFRHLARRIQENGGEVLATTRHKEVTVQLCQAYGLPQRILSRKRYGMLGSGVEFFERTAKLSGVARWFRPDALLGTSVSIGTVGKLIRRPSFVFQEDDADVVPSFARIAYSTSTYIVTPDCLRDEEHGTKHLTYPGYHELAYLHPDIFTPNPSVVRSLGLEPDEPYFILRFVALQAHHDTEARGIDQETATELVRLLSAHGKVLITSEGELADAFRPYQFPLPPEKLHDTLAFAALCIGDSQTVTAEAAVLGVPNIRCNSFVGRISYLEELEHVHQLTLGLLPHENERLLSTVTHWLQDLEGRRCVMEHNRRFLLQKCVNLTDWQYEMLRARVEGAEPIF